MAQNMKSFNVKIPKELWVYLKTKAAKEDKAMWEIIASMLAKDKEKSDKKNLTNHNANV